MLTATDIRRRFLEFFRSHGHEVVSSAPLIPPNDPSLLFTNAGMVQFKKLFLGEERRDYSTAASCQKCLRVSGKHNDLENVGRTARHHTFFEMLGNFSFGDYFKREAITLAWDFVTKELGLPGDKLWVTVFKEDAEAAALWGEIAGLPPDRIVPMGEKDNFWTMGETGPCGPCSEIYIDQGEEMSCGPDCGIGRCDCDRFLEIWNLVFTQFDQAADGTRTPLASPNIDTGMGLERIAAVCQGKRSNFDCDLFQDIIQHAARLAGVTYSHSLPDTNDVDTALRVIADHGRAAAFLIAGGVLPSNENRGYVLRRLLRRALRFAALIGVKDPYLHKVTEKVVETMSDAYPELAESARFISRAVLEEEQRFSRTLANGLQMLEEELAALTAAGSTMIPGKCCFTLYDTYGFPLDIVVDVAEKRGFTVDHAGFEVLMEEQRERARQNRKKTMQAAGIDTGQALAKLLEEGIESVFVGYDTLTCESRIVSLLDGDGVPASSLPKGARGFAVTGKTPFYGESGGQVGDVGTMTSATAEAEVVTTHKPSPTLTIHEIEIRSGELLPDQEVALAVDKEKRLATARNHTCTHLLHAALRRRLGTHVKQAGSQVDPHRLRFDFSHITGLTPEELALVEADVNRALLEDMPVTVSLMSKDEAMQTDAMALFDDKYGKTVRVVRIGEGDAPESMELCGGTHLTRTGQAGSFLIQSETGISAGTRRIEAVTGANAYAVSIEQRRILQELGGLLKTRPDQMAERVHGMADEIKKLRKQGPHVPQETMAGKDIAAEATDVGGVRLLTKTVANVPMKALRELMDDVRSRLDRNAVACLASTEGEKVNLLLYVSKDLHQRFTAPALIKDVAAACGGTGGGRDDLAQAGGNAPGNVDSAFQLLRQRVA
ncbi:MAG: alanine--tRNA ligase [Desulfovibrio sp.]|jgi:alanyl-tRNA synthetase|nr:alanine--tRNA ligase [Desulfovibrio sp.]